MVRHTTIPSRVVVIISTVAIALVLLLPSTGKADGATATETHIVQTGDTLWTIADRVTPPGEDVRNSIEQIKELNDLTASLIVPGQQLLVPSHDAGS